MIIETGKLSRAALAFLLSLVIVFSCGCGHLPWRAKTIATVSTPSGAKVEQSGNVETPAHVETNQTRTEIQVSKDTKISVVAATPESPSKLVVENPAPATIIQTQTVEKATAPKTVAPPTPKELAAADNLKWYYIAGVIFLLAAAALGYAGHLKAAAFAVLGAFLAPVLGQLANSEFALIAVLVCGAVSLTLFVTWYLVQNHPEIKTKISAEFDRARSELSSLAKHE